MRFIPLLSGQTGRRLFYRRTCGVDFGWDKSCRIDTNASSYWSARTAAYSSHPEVLPSCWPLSVTRGRRSIIYQHIAPIYFTEWRKSHCAEGASLPPSQQVAFYKHGVKGAAGPVEEVPSPQVRPPALEDSYQVIKDRQGMREWPGLNG